MFTNSEIIQSIMQSKKVTVYDVYKKCNRAGYVYKNFKENRFSANFIHKIEELVGVDLSVFINIGRR